MESLLDGTFYPLNFVMDGGGGTWLVGIELSLDTPVTCSHEPALIGKLQCALIGTKTN